MTIDEYIKAKREFGCACPEMLSARDCYLTRHHLVEHGYGDDFHLEVDPVDDFDCECGCHDIDSEDCDE